ncbi:hypothetical protein, partial [Acinetobacter sp.]|uniref:hypothetical protein n=1 Tax=Acinetobacter sp. TaxID=472 RepID=UPI002648705C
FVRKAFVLRKTYSLSIIKKFVLQKQSIPNTTQVADDASVYQIEFKLKKKMPVNSKTDRHTFENNIFFKLKWYAL